MPKSFRHLRKERLGDGKDLAVQKIEAAGDLARQLHVGKLIDADRDAVGLVHDDVRRLENRIAEKTERREVFLDKLLLHLLVRRIPLQPGEGGDHGEQQKQFGVLLDARLDEERAFHRIKAGREPVDHHVDGVRPDFIGFRVIARECMPVGYEVIAVIRAVVLQCNPVRKRTMKVAQMELSRGPHPAQNPFSWSIMPPEGAISASFRLTAVRAGATIIASIRVRCVPYHDNENASIRK